MSPITDNPEKSPNADISDHEAKAREILESCRPTQDDHPSLFHAISAALREAEERERERERERCAKIVNDADDDVECPTCMGIHSAHECVERIAAAIRSRNDG